MNKISYLTELNKALRNQGKGEIFTNACMQYAERLLDNNLPVIFDIEHFSFLVGIEFKELTKILFAEDLFYHEQQIPKKAGDYRLLLIPAAILKYIQRWILDIILINIPVSEYATGFCPKKSIVINALKHVGKECVISFDIKDFFPTITNNMIFKIFYYYGYTKEVSFMLSKLCTYNGFLPQGSPASPYLSNIVCLKLDKRMSRLAKKYEADYTRYADDITISGHYGLGRCIKIVEKIINDESFSPNPQKTRISYKYQRQEVTGLIVNQGKVMVPKVYKRKVKQEIYYCTKYGVDNHLEHIGCNKSFYKEHLYGKAYFIKMVEPEDGKEILELLDALEWDY